MTLREFCRLFAHEVEDGFIIISDKPGIGIELAEDAMEKYPFKDRRRNTRLHVDGSVVDQ